MTTSSMRWETRRVLVVAKTYPNPSRTHRETVCTAGIDDQGQWLRMYPVRYRDLPAEQQFRKFDWIEARLRKAADPRPESHNIDNDSIRVVERPSRPQWERRRELLLQACAPSVESLTRDYDDHGRSLGIIKPVVRSFEVTPDPEPWWSVEQVAALSGEAQMELYPDLWDPQSKRPLEKASHQFSYSFTDDEPGCHGHAMRVLDWEVYAYWRRMSGQDEQARLASMQKQFGDYLVAQRDLHFIMGTVSSHPRTWLIIGLFYPPVSHQPTLPFD